MKLNNTLIVTLSDFARHFTFPAFWANRQQFVRDLCPEKVYYLNNEQKQAYIEITKWIQEGELNTNSDKTLLCNALEELLGYKVDNKEVEAFFHPTVMDSDIIVVNAPTTFDLPKFEKTSDDPFTIKLRKLQIEGNVGQEAEIHIGGELVAKLKSGEVTYVTEADGKYIEILPNHIYSDRYDASLVDTNGEFYSTLVIYDKKNASKYSWDGVISFALVDDGYLFVDKQGSLIVMSESTPRFLLKSEGKAIYIKSFNDKVLVLYEDGNLKSTISMQKISNVISANFNSEGSIEHI